MVNLNINKIAIIGLGLLGGSIAKAIKRSDSQIKVYVYDKKNVIENASNENIIDFNLEKIEDAVCCDLIILCTPTELSLEIFKKLIPLLSENSIISDVCGVKGIFEKEWNKGQNKGVYIGGHPMTGKEKGGYQNSDPLLFENAVYIISESAKGNKRESDFLEFVKMLGARAIYLDPFLHDKVVANVSHLPQLLSIALLNTVSSNNNKTNYLDFAAGGFKDLTRIASSDFNVWESILKMNKFEIVETINSFQSNLDVLKKNLEFEDFLSLRSLFENAKTNRESIAENKKGFITPLFDLFIFINDEPGILFNITKSLAKENINIKDIELQKIRENVGGTFRLSFSSLEELEKAKTTLKKSGFVINI